MGVIDKSAIVSSTAIIHDNVTIEEDVTIHDYVVIYPNTVIKKGAIIYDHCVLGKIPTSPGNVARQLKEKYDTLVIGENSIICPHATIYCGVTIGKRVLLGDNCSIREECRIGDDCLISRNVSVNYNTTIGNRTKVMDNSHITGDMIIEEDVFISVLVSTTNDNTMGRQIYSENRVRGPHIKRWATVGAGANILPSVTIGENSIIGAGSVVTKSIEDRKVAMGIPAKVVRDVLEEELKQL